MICLLSWFMLSICSIWNCCGVSLCRCWLILCFLCLVGGMLCVFGGV